MFQIYNNRKLAVDSRLRIIFNLIYTSNNQLGQDCIPYLSRNFTLYSNFHFYSTRDRS